MNKLVSSGDTGLWNGYISDKFIIKSVWYLLSYSMSGFKEKVLWLDYILITKKVQSWNQSKHYLKCSLNSKRVRLS